MAFPYESIYPGASYLLDPNYNFTGYRVAAGHMGATTGTQTANQLDEVTKLLNQGIKTTEVSVIQPDIFESMPKDHLKEIRRLNQLTGAESTLHAPIIDPSGFTDQGWSEQNREVTERQFNEFVERGHDLDPNGNIPVTIHSSTIPGSELIPDKEKGEVYGRMIAVDRDTGQFIPLYREKRFYPNKPEGEIYEPEKELEIANVSYWDQQLSQLVFSKERGDQLLQQNYYLIADKFNEKDENLTPGERIAKANVGNATVFLNNTYQSLNTLFNQAYKASDDKGKDALKTVAKETQNDFNNYRQSGDINSYQRAIQNLITNMQQVTSGVIPGTDTQIPIPQKYLPVEEFATDKASDTLSSVAVNAYKKFGKTAPIVSIENPPYGQAIATGDELKKLIEETRRKFTNKLIAQGKSKDEAKRAAERQIGATWDTSHISMIRKQGFGKEKLIEEAGKIAPFVKHVHFNDNFGTTHTDLPPGMGDVPMKEVMEKLEKGGFKGKKIFEGGNWFAKGFRQSPFPYQLEYSGSPIYTAGGTPTWNQLGAYGNYFSGMGPINPPVHHSTYGAGFQNLPLELGGNIPGDQGRFSGTPNY